MANGHAFVSSPVKAIYKTIQPLCGVAVPAQPKPIHVCSDVRSTDFSGDLLPRSALLGQKTLGWKLSLQLNSCKAVEVGNDFKCSGRGRCSDLHTHNTLPTPMWLFLRRDQTGIWNPSWCNMAEGRESGEQKQLLRAFLLSAALSVQIFSPQSCFANGSVRLTFLDLGSRL